MKHTRFIFSLAVVAVVASCSTHQKNASTSVAQAEPVAYTGATTQLASTPVSDLPMAVVYRTSEPCENLVPVTVVDGKLISYPAPTDLTDDSTPVALANGYLLSRRGGINADTRFTNWTFKEYRAMDSAPTPERILSNLSDIRVTDVMEIKDMTPWQAAADTAAVNRMIRARIPSLPVD